MRTLQPIQGEKKVVTKTYNDAEIQFHLTILEDDVRINAITLCNRDIFGIIDPEIRRAAYEDFKHQFITYDGI